MHGLFVTQRDYRTNPSCSRRGYITCQQNDRRQKSRDTEERDGIACAQADPA
jgi:hypothetical protein